MTETDKTQGPSALRSALQPKLRALILELWQNTRIDWGFATDKLSSTFRQNKWLGGAERRVVSEVLYGMIRHARRIDCALQRAGLTITAKAPDRQRLLAFLVLEGELEVAEAGREDASLDWTKVATVDEHLQGVRDPIKRVALRHSLPDFLAEKLVRELGIESAESLAAALNQRAPMSVRVNTLKTTREALREELRKLSLETTEGALSATCLHVDTRTNLFNLPPFRDGWFEAQDEGSQLVCELVDAPDKGFVVDYCAGAGGKTLALAAALGNRGRVMASDIDKRKLAELRRRAKRAGATNIQSVELPPDAGAAFPKPFERRLGQADRVLVDAPCTGLGSLRRNPEARFRLQPADFERLPQTQARIAARAFELVRPGGHLIYATCTLLEAENQNIAMGLLERFAGAELVPPSDILGPERAAGLCDPSGRFVLLRPDRHGCDGFFAAVIRRRD